VGLLYELTNVSVTAIAPSPVGSKIFITMEQNPLNSQIAILERLRSPVPPYEG
jgi:hypothetical protein